MEQLHWHRIEHFIAHHHTADVVGQCIHPLHFVDVCRQLSLLTRTQTARHVNDGVALHFIPQRF